MSLDTYFPWVQRVAWIADWFYRILLDQMGSKESVMFPPMLWPGWDWAQVNALYSHRAAPWSLSYLLRNEWDDDDDLPE